MKGSTSEEAEAAPISDVRGFATPFRIEAGSGRVVRASGATKIRQNLVTLLRTEVGERFLRRTYGGGLRDLLHEPLDDALHALVERRVAAAVGEFEPLIALDDVLVDRDGGVLVAELRYRIRADGTADRIAITLDTEAP